MSINLAVKKREFLGKKLIGLRLTGLVPAELYGRGIDNVHLTVKSKDFVKTFKQAGSNSIINLNIEGADEKEARPVLIYDVSRHSVTDDVLSVDFYQVRMDEEVVVEVPLVLVGESPAVKDLNGVLVQVMKEIEVEALPNKVPKEIEVDLSKITKLDSGIAVKDLKVPEGVEILADGEAVIVMVKEQMTEEEDLAQSQSVDASKVEVAGDKKEKESEVEAGADEKASD